MSKELSQISEIYVKEDDVTIFDKKVEDKDNDMTDDEFVFKQILVADLTSDSAVNLGGLAKVNFIAVKTDQIISIKLNGTGTTAITLSANGITILNTNNITTIHISNASGEDANVEIYLTNLE